jgi:hypothetical protein
VVQKVSLKLLKLEEMFIKDLVLKQLLKQVVVH